MESERAEEGEMIDSGAICSFIVRVKSQLSVGTETGTRQHQTDNTGSCSHLTEINAV